MRRDLAANDDDTVCIWVCRTRGSTSELGARANRAAAKAWVARRIDAAGEWRGDRGKQIYKTGEESLETGSIELVPVHDIAAILVEEM